MRFTPEDIKELMPLIEDVIAKKTSLLQADIAAIRTILRLGNYEIPKEDEK